MNFLPPDITNLSISFKAMKENLPNEAIKHLLAKVEELKAEKIDDVKKTLEEVSVVLKEFSDSEKNLDEKAKIAFDKLKTVVENSKVKFF